MLVVFECINSNIIPQINNIKYDRMCIDLWEIYRLKNN